MLKRTSIVICQSVHHCTDRLAQVEHFGKMEELRSCLADQMESMAKSSPVAVKEEEEDDDEETDEAGQVDGASGGGAIQRVREEGD